MAGEDSEQDKSELATPYKLKKSREKGQVARGTDLGFFTGLTTFLVYMWIFGDGFVEAVRRASRGALVAGPGVVGASNELMAMLGGVLIEAAKPIALMAAAMFAVVLLFELIQTGVVFSAAPLKIDFNRLSPAQGLKRIFTARMLVETLKNVIKLIAYAAIAYVVLRQAVDLGNAAMHDGVGLARGMWSIAFRLIACFAGAAVVFAVIDQLIARRDFTKKMRMSRRDVRRESRDREGDPRLKQKRKQLHADFVKMSQSLRGIRGADVLVTNPTHYAVALRYDRSIMTAPRVVSRGANQFALRLRRLAFLHGVIIVREPGLARALYFKGQLNEEIPEFLFQPVADLYLDLRVRQRAPEPDIDPQTA
jgi:flagellar biosynthetic protein FlhB